MVTVMVLIMDRVAAAKVEACNYPLLSLDVMFCGNKKNTDNDDAHVGAERTGMSTSGSSSLALADIDAALQTFEGEFSCV